MRHVLLMRHILTIDRLLRLNKLSRVKGNVVSANAIKKRNRGVAEEN